MKRKIKVKHTHRYTLEKDILFDGYADCNEFQEYLEYIYYEENNVKVVMYIFESYMQIKRFGEVQSTLTFKKEEHTMNLMNSVYGSFEIEIYTYDFQKKGYDIIVEYDIENGSDEKDGFKIEIEVEDKGYEFH